MLTEPVTRWFPPITRARSGTSSSTTLTGSHSDTYCLLSMVNLC